MSVIAPATQSIPCRSKLIRQWSPAGSHSRFETCIAPRRIAIPLDGAVEARRSLVASLLWKELHASMGEDQIALLICIGGMNESVAG